MSEQHKKNEKNFLIQGSILAIAGVITKLIGAFYRIPLLNIIGTEGNGYYSFRLASDTTKVMDLQDGNKASGTNIQVKTATGADSEKFEIIPMGNAAYGIRPKLGRGNISVNIANGTNVNATTTTQGSKQQFYKTNFV